MQLNTLRKLQLHPELLKTRVLVIYGGAFISRNHFGVFGCI